MLLAWQRITLLYLWVLLKYVYKYQEAVNKLPSQLTIINTNYLDLEQEVQQLPVHSTSFPPVAGVVLFIPCFFRYAFCSHVDSRRRLKHLSRREAFHHNTSKDVAFLFHFHTRVCSHVSAGELLNPHLLIQRLISILETLAQPSQDAQLLFCARLAGKSIFVQIILATSLVYSELKTEPLCGSAGVPGGSEVQSLERA